MYGTTLSWGHIHFSTYFVTKSHIENYIDRTGIPQKENVKAVNQVTLVPVSHCQNCHSDVLKFIQFIFINIGLFI